MKIAMLTPYYNKVTRGNERFAQRMEEHFDIDVFFVPEKRKFKLTYKFQELLSKGMIDSAFTKFIGIEPKPVEFYFHNYWLEHIDEFRDYDIIWSQSCFWSVLLGKKISKRLGKPFVVTWQGNFSATLVLTALLNPDLLVVLTPEFKDRLPKFLQKNVKCIPSGIELDKFRKGKRYKTKIHSPIFLSTSSLTKSKNVDMIIEALSLCSGGSLIITSDGPDRDRILDLAQKKIPGRYKYLGVVDIDTLISLYNVADVYVQASQSEGLSAALLEAMATNTPVVAPEDNNRKWTIGNGGETVKYRTPYNFIKTMMHANMLDWDNRPREQAEKFDWKDTIKKYKDEFKCLVKKTADTK